MASGCTRPFLAPPRRYVNESQEGHSIRASWERPFQPNRVLSLHFPTAPKSFLAALGGTNWVNVGAAEAGNGSEVCVIETFSAATDQFYRLQLSPWFHAVLLRLPVLCHRL
jgi:hypothetical protein